MAKASELFTIDQLKTFFRISKLEEHLKNQVCDIRTLSQYQAFNELRLINNAIKHSGIINKELATYPGFKKGQKLTELHKHYYRLRDDVDSFLIELQKKILSRI